MMRVAGYSRDEALAFVDAIRSMLAGKPGFKWLVERLSDLTDYIETTAAENERLNAYVDSIGARDDFERSRGVPAEAQRAVLGEQPKK
ncbi:MAG: hypothetical protein P4L93_06625 [Coriobacteriia bacterium]|nr:hypothetical protein [Coriobacteriia bacterium]